jgi:hypothetical protein
MDHFPIVAGRQIKAARALLDVRLKDVSAACGPTKQTICRIENAGASRPDATMDTMVRLLEYFKTQGVGFYQDKNITGVFVIDQAPPAIAHIDQEAR